MSLAQKATGSFDNYLGLRDEHAVISEALYPPLPRYNPADSGADPLLLKTWAKMDLAHVFGFPTWEAAVFKLFAASFGELSSIFTYYAKTGTAGSASANGASIPRFRSGR